MIPVDDYADLADRYTTAAAARDAALTTIRYVTNLLDRWSNIDSTSADYKLGVEDVVHDVRLAIADYLAKGER